MATTNSSPLLGLPDDLLQRVLVGIPRDDHGAAAAACGAFRAIIRGPRFLRLRREFGFAERAVLLLSGRFRINQDESIDGCLEIHAAQKRGFAESFFEHKVSIIESTTDGAARIFFCTNVKTGNEILVMDASTCRWSRFATLPQNQKGQCMLWHGSGLLYVAGGYVANTGGYLSSLHAFNEVTGLWETLPSMPHACMCAVSAVIGDQLFVLGGYEAGPEMASTNILQIYDIPTRTWRVGASKPDGEEFAAALAVDGKLFCVDGSFSVRYDPHSDTWTEIPGPPRPGGRRCSCVHNGRIVAFYHDGAAFERANDGSWSPYQAVADVDALDHRSLACFGSVLLG
ncbi:unnamed protein product [Pelagomonas calceolata]|uniref:F-box domain-containing protein n=1 Tax=Pelagomonas calceolata TaxID=35677 RepID=A0A8J2WWG0_9STRA|nr:unnamed protein product [Pelagomonas calceolata]CAH0380381.1 unnamed protein product [Pelagomonas calceolata]